MSHCIGCLTPFRNPEPTDFKMQGWYEFKGNCYCTRCWQKLWPVLLKVVPCPV